MSSLNTRLSFNSTQSRKTRRSVVDVETGFTAVAFATVNALEESRCILKLITTSSEQFSYWGSIHARKSLATRCAAKALISYHARVSFQARLSSPRDASRSSFAFRAGCTNKAGIAVIAFLTFGTYNHSITGIT